jgi:hypothetical protein
MLGNGDAMENTILHQSKKILDDNGLFLASGILMEANRAVRDVQMIVAALLRYAMIGVSITNNLMDLIVTTAPEEQ